MMSEEFWIQTNLAKVGELFLICVVLRTEKVSIGLLVRDELLKDRTDSLGVEVAFHALTESICQASPNYVLHGLPVHPGLLLLHRLRLQYVQRQPQRQMIQDRQWKTIEHPGEVLLHIRVDLLLYRQLERHRLLSLRLL